MTSVPVGTLGRKIVVAPGVATKVVLPGAPCKDTPEREAVAATVRTGEVARAALGGMLRTCVSVKAAVTDAIRRAMSASESAVSAGMARMVPPESAAVMVESVRMMLA